MSRLHQMNSPYFCRVASKLAVLVVMCCVFILPDVAVGQIPPVVQLPEAPAPTPPENPQRSLAEWQADVKARMKSTEQQQPQQQAEDGNSKPSLLLKQQLERLAQIDFTLGQIKRGKEESGKIKKSRLELKKQLDQLTQLGLGKGNSFSIRELDQARDVLRVEQRRLKRFVEKEKTAISALEKAQQDFKKKNSSRRLIKEKSEENTDDELRQSLSEELAAAEQASEQADAIAQLHKQELVNARATIGRQELQVKLLREREARLQGVAKFGVKELNEFLVELDRQKYKLERAMTASERAEETEKNTINHIERQLNLSTNKNANDRLQERLSARQLNKYLQQDQQKLLTKQLKRLSDLRMAWQRRHQLLTLRPQGKNLLEWIAETDEVLASLDHQLKDDADAEEGLKVSRQELKNAKDKLSSLQRNSQLTQEVAPQVEILQQRVEAHEQELASIRTTQQLFQKLKAELASDSLADKAKNQLLGLWSTVGSLWNFELTSFGDKSVTVQKVVTALLILLAGIIFSRALSRALGRQVLRRLDIDASASATIQSLFYYALLLMFGLFALNVAKVPLTAFTVLGGAVALGIGFGSQNIINNFISGLILHAERPVKVGDLIQLDNLNGKPLYGNIEHIGARSTRVRTGSNLEIIVPNSSFLQNNVVNFTLSNDKVRTMVEVGVVYGSPTVTVTQLLRRAVIETGRVAKDPPPIILFKSFGDNSLLFEVHFWIRMRTMMDQMQIESAVRFRIDQLFREEEIVIAFPQSDVHLDTSSPLTIQMIEPSTGENPS